WFYSASGQPVPVRWLLLAFAILLFLAMIRAFHEVRIERDDLKHYKTDIESARPRLSCTGQKFVSLYQRIPGPASAPSPRASPSSSFTTEYRSHALQVWISNQPEVRTSASMAQAVSVRVTFYREGSVFEMFSLVSQWVNAIDPDHAMYDGTSD